jgi:hypothetical protein
MTQPKIVRPEVGDIVTVRGIACEVVKVRPFGTVDVRALDGSGRSFRVSGLRF